jgi:hypothetical protein
MVTSTRQSRTIRGDCGTRILGAVVLAAAIAGSARAVTGWPPFLPPRETWSPDVASSIERVWTDPTLRRAVEGRSAPVPFDVYTRFVDSPAATAATARHLGLAQYEVRRIGEQLYEADDQRGARGFYPSWCASPASESFSRRAAHRGAPRHHPRGSAHRADLPERRPGNQARSDGLRPHREPWRRVPGPRAHSALRRPGRPEARRRVPGHRAGGRVGGVEAGGVLRMARQRAGAAGRPRSGRRVGGGGLGGGHRAPAFVSG